MQDPFNGSKSPGHTSDISLVNAIENRWPNVIRTQFRLTDNFKDADIEESHFFGASDRYEHFRTVCVSEPVMQ